MGGDGQQKAASGRRLSAAKASINLVSDSDDDAPLANRMVKGASGHAGVSKGASTAGGRGSKAIALSSDDEGGGGRKRKPPSVKKRVVKVNQSEEEEEEEGEDDEDNGSDDDDEEQEEEDGSEDDEDVSDDDYDGSD